MSNNWGYHGLAPDVIRELLLNLEDPRWTEGSGGLTLRWDYADGENALLIIGMNKLHGCFLRYEPPGKAAMRWAYSVFKWSTDFKPTAASMR